MQITLIRFLKNVVKSIEEIGYKKVKTDCCNFKHYIIRTYNKQELTDPCL